MSKEAQAPVEDETEVGDEIDFVESSNDMIDNEPQEEQQEEQQDNETNIDEQPSQDKHIASALGWKDENEHTGDPDSWMSATAFLKFHGQQQTINQLKKGQKDFDSRLEQNNKLHEFSMQNLKKNLESKRYSAVEEGDTEAFKTHQAQIDELNQNYQPIQPPSQPPTEPEIENWVGRNPWVDKNNAAYDAGRAQVADGLLKSIENSPSPGTRVEQLQLLDNQLNNIYGTRTIMPKTISPGNPNRMAPNTTESAAPINRKNRNKEVKSLSDLTKDEKDYWDESAQYNYSGNQKAFFKVVQDARTGAGG